MAENNNSKSTAEINLHASVDVTFKRSLTRKNSTGKSNYATLKSGKITIIRYINGVKSMTNKVYRRIQPSD